MTKGEQMLIDLGYDINKTYGLVWFEKENSFGEQYFINFSIYDKNIYFDWSYRDTSQLNLSTEETMAIYQIIKDYGWFE